MKSNSRYASYTLIIVLLLANSLAKAQITLHSSDMPSANDTIRLSNASPLSPGIDLTITGPNTTWDFSQLQWATQTVDTFFSVLSTGFIYQIAFISSSFAQKGQDVTAIPTVQLTNVYNFYGKTSSLFQQNGIGATLNGVQTPLIFSSKDVIYHFPLNFSDQDTSNSIYGIAIPSLGSYNANQTRINDVDGWGTVITPFGSFSCLRVKSELTGHDSVFITASSTGFGLDRNLTREYKWLATGMKVPVLQINTQEILPGNEVITSIVYRDSARLFTVGIDENSDYSLLTVYPNPVADIINVKMLNKKPGYLQYELYSSAGQKLFTSSEYSAASITNKSVCTANYPSGIYMLRIISDTAIYNRRIIISRK